MCIEERYMCECVRACACVCLYVCVFRNIHDTVLKMYVPLCLLKEALVRQVPALCNDL